MVEEDKRKKSKMGKLVGGGVGFLAAAPVLFKSLGWAAVIVCVLGAVAFGIKIVKELKRK